MSTNDWIEEAIAKGYLKYYEYKNFSNIQEIGSGAFAKVYRANWKNSERCLVLKSFFDFDELKIKEIERELKLQREVDFHDNIIRLHGVTKYGSESQINPLYHYSLVMEYADGGTLRSYLKKKFNNLTWDDKLDIAYQFACAVSCLHDEGIVHSDLHPKNVLVHQNVIKLSDFGFSRRIEETSKTQTRLFGVIPYVDPKRLLKTKYKLNEKSDVYSVGVILWEISSGQSPFLTEGESCDTYDIGLALEISSGFREKPIHNTPDAYVKLYTECWNGEPENRPTMSEVVSQLKKIRSTINEKQQRQSQQQQQQQQKQFSGLFSDEYRSKSKEKQKESDNRPTTSEVVDPIKKLVSAVCGNDVNDLGRFIGGLKNSGLFSDGYRDDRSTYNRNEESNNRDDETEETDSSGNVHEHQRQQQQQQQQFSNLFFDEYKDESSTKKGKQREPDNRPTMNEAIDPIKTFISAIDGNYVNDITSNLGQFIGGLKNPGLFSDEYRNDRSTYSRIEELDNRNDETEETDSLYNTVHEHQRQQQQQQQFSNLFSDEYKDESSTKKGKQREPDNRPTISEVIDPIKTFMSAVNKNDVNDITNNLGQFIGGFKNLGLFSDGYRDDRSTYNRNEESDNRPNIVDMFKTMIVEDDETGNLDNTIHENSRPSSDEYRNDLPTYNTKGKQSEERGLDIDDDLFTNLNTMIREIIDIMEELSLNEGKELNKQIIDDYCKKYNMDSEGFYNLLRLLNQKDSKDLNSIFLFGNFNYLGIGTNVNKEKAFKLYHEAADSGHDMAQHKLGCMYKDGIYVIKDYNKAFDMFKRSAKGECLDGIIMLGECYLNGIGTIVNIQKALELYIKVANLGYSVAQYKLAQVYRKNEDHDKAFELFEKSAAKGKYSSGINMLGECYYNGIGTNVNKELGFELYQKATDLGDSKAPYNLALMYEKGEYVNQDSDKALEFYKKSYENVIMNTKVNFLDDDYSENGQFGFKNALMEKFPLFIDQATNDLTDERSKQSKLKYYQTCAKIGMDGDIVKVAENFLVKGGEILDVFNNFKVNI